jgi:hypothetical protein
VTPCASAGVSLGAAAIDKESRTTGRARIFRS